MTDTIQSKNDPLKILYNSLLVVGVMFIFLVSLKMMGGSFKIFGKDFAHALLTSTSNPFIGLFIGLLSTAIIQSSSTTTSMIVVMVASGDLTLNSAVPMLMGANVGTSVTSTFVSMGHMGSKKEYKKAVSAATVHDFFNLMVVCIMLPLELSFGFLSKSAEALAALFVSESSGPEMFSILGATVKPVAKYILKLTSDVSFLPDIVAVFIPLVSSLVLLMGSLYFLTKILKKLLIGNAQKKMDKLLFENPVKSILWGTFLTAGVQSSSVTTSLVVPLVATNKVSLRKAFPFLMGANIGTTITALIAALSAENQYVALSVAFAHVLFNLLGTVIIFPIKPLRDIPIKLARKLGKSTLKNKFVGIAYIGVTFFLIPFLLIMISGGSKSSIIEYKIENKDLISGVSTYTFFVDQVEKETGITNRKIYANLETSNYSTHDQPTNEIVISKTDKTISVGNNLYMITSKDVCFDRKEGNKKVKLCVDDIKSSFELNNNTIEECYVFSKTYYDLQTVDSIYEKIYLDSKNGLVIKREVFNKTGKKIMLEELK